MYEHDIAKQSRFSRTQANEKKLGAYYTDLEMCRRIGNLFSFPEEKECCILEPSIGDATAVLTVTGKEEGVHENLKIFGVEIKESTYKENKENPLIDYPLLADFIKGVRISNNAFSFCFSNPPYGDDHETGNRLETVFAEKIWHYLKPNGILAFVIPYYVLSSEDFLKTFFKCYQPIATYRFDDAVYQQFKQVVIVAMKRWSLGYLKDSYDAYFESIDELEKLPYLPKNKAEDPIPIGNSDPDKIVYFCPMKFNAAEAGEHLGASPLHQFMGEKMFIPSYSATELPRPPLPLKKDLLYLVATAGGGQGMVGSEANRDMHLQRGIAKVVKTTEVRDSEKGVPQLVEVQSTKICMTVIENNGRITTLE